MNHAKEARDLLQPLQALAGKDEAFYLELAQVHATLALAEQQRVANLIALGEQWKDTGHPALDAVAPELRSDIQDALELGDPEEEA